MLRDVFRGSYNISNKEVGGRSTKNRTVSTRKKTKKLLDSTLTEAALGSRKAGRIYKEGARI